MRFFTLTILVAVALRSEALQDKRGVAASQPPASLAYTKLQQPIQKTVEAPQPHFFTQAAPSPAAYAIPYQQQIQYQPQPQPVTYAQPAVAKYASAPAKVAAAPVYRQPFSLANDVSSFAYSSPVVSYNSLGLLQQVVGKAAQAKPAAPAPVAYQAQVQPSIYSTPQRFAQPAQRLVAAAPQQYLSQAPQQTYISSPQAQAQTYQASQTYTAQSVPQSIYSEAPQYFTQAKQPSPGVAYAQ